MGLHYLRFRDYGRFSAPDDRDTFIDRDKLSSRHYVMTNENLYSYIVIDDFAIDIYSGVKIIASRNHKKSLHAEFNIAAGSLRVATWHRPVVKRIFWFGFPLQLTTYLDSDMQERLRTLRDDSLVGLPRAIELTIDRADHET